MKKSILMKITACIAVVVLSPLIAKYAAEYGDISVRYAEVYAEHTPVPIENGNGSIVMYKPYGQTENITLPTEPADTGGNNANRNTADISTADGSASEKDNTTAPADTAADENNYEGRIIARNIAVHNESLGEINEKDGIIKERVIHGNGGDIHIGDTGEYALVRNLTKNIPDSLLSEEARIPPDFKINKDEPAVLILHTHTTEAYRRDESGVFSGQYGSRDGDPDKSVVAVGQELAKSIAKAGYTVIHDGTVHDNPYKGAYTRSAATTRQILKEYPSIKVVLDVHRDAIEEVEADGSVARVSAAVSAADGKAAQIMIIAAADGGGYSVPDYLQNFRFACAVTRSIADEYGELARPVLFEHCGYNQELAPGSLLIEVGSHGNSLAEAKYTAELIGGRIAAVLDEMR